MQHPLAYCKEHGFFAASAFAFAAGAKVTISGCSTSCPTCGTPSEIVPGAYAADLNSMNILVDASISKDALLALRKLLTRVEAGEISPAQAMAEATKISPRLGGLFDPSTWSPEVKAATVGAVAFLLGQASGCDRASMPGPVFNFYSPRHEQHAPKATPHEKYSARLTARLRDSRRTERAKTPKA